MKKINKIISVLLVALILMTIVPTSAFAASEAIWLLSGFPQRYVDYRSGVTQYLYYKQSQTNSYLYKVTYSNMKNVTEVGLGIGEGYFSGRLNLYLGTTNVDGLYGNHYYGGLITSDNKTIYTSNLPKTTGAKLSCLMDFEEITINPRSAIVTFTCVAVNKSEWTWNGTSSATTKFTSTDGKAYINVTAYAAQTVARAENCKSRDQITYTATINFNGTTYTDTKTSTGNVGPHLYTNSKCKYCSRVCYHGSSLVTVDAKAPTCTGFGWNAYQYCTACDYTTYVKIPANPDAHNIIIDDAVAPDCNNSGLTEGSHCSVCNKVLVGQQIVPSNGHTEGACVIENKTDSTCSSEGKYDAVIYCSVCSVELSRETITTDKLPHTEVIDNAVEATCINTGLTEGSHCKVCGVVIKEQTEVKKTDHTYESDVTAPTCIAQGYTTYTCKCGDSYVADYVDALDHSFTKQLAEEKYFKSAATYSSPAEYYYACESCLLKGDESYTFGEALKLGQPEVVSATQTTDSINLSWSAVPDATGYRVFVRENNKWVQIKKSTAETEYTVTGLTAGTKYTYAVRAYIIVDDTVIWAPTFTTFVAATQPALISKVTSTKQTATSVTLSWDAVNCGGYRVFRYNTETKKWDIVVRSTKSTTATITDLTENTNYIFAVRPYVNTGTEIIWAKTYTRVDTSTMLPAITLKVLSSAKNRATIAWGKAAGATGYQVWYSTSPSSGYKKVANYTNNSTYQYNLTSGTTYYYRARAYKAVSGSYVYGAWSDVVSVTIK